jgi:hypothetical protein
MKLLACLLLALAAAEPMQDDAARLFERGQSFEQFLAHVSAQRDDWLAAAAHADVDPEQVDRLARARDGVQLLGVAEDWCVDSVHVVPYVARLADRAHIEFRIVDRATGRTLLARHPTRDGRPATPTIVVIRNGVDAGAWVERPAPLQDLFARMATDPESARRFADRGRWYDEDRGRTTVAELVALIGKR